MSGRKLSENTTTVQVEPEPVDPTCTVCGKPATWKIGRSPRCVLHLTTKIRGA